MITTPSAEPRGVWVYAVAGQIPRVSLDEVTGVGGEVPRAIAAAGLAAIAGDVGLAEFGEAPLRSNLEDLAWLEATARAHHRVIEAAARQEPVVPMRLATVYRDDANVATMLAERGADFRAALERRRQQLAAQHDTRQAAASGGAEIHAVLSRLAVGVRLHPPQSQQLSGSTAPMIFNAAYLLDAERGGKFAEAVADLADQHPAVRLELTGPWPPYSFATLEPAGPPQAP